VALAWVRNLPDFFKGLPERVGTWFAEVRAELKKVTWPSRKEVYGTTIVVIVTVFFFGFYLFFVDSILQILVSKLFSLFL
jgi:preprotein translocase subunit SecE